MSRLAALVVAAAALLAALALVLVANRYSMPAGAASAGQSDLTMYALIADRMRQGQSYYAAAHEALLQGAYGTRSVFNWRLPTLATLESLLPSEVWAAWLLRLAALGAGLLALLMVYRSAGRTAAALLIPALTLNLISSALPGAAIFADTVAGVLILISASAYGLKRPALGFAAALLALTVRELAAPYVVICILFAWRERRPAELWAWLAGLAAFGAYFAWHYSMVEAQLGPGDVAYPEGWLQFGGPGFMLTTARFNGMLLAAPLWVTAILLPFCLLGRAGWRGSCGARIGLTVAAYVALFTLAGKPFDYYWGALYTPLMMVGLPFLPAAVRDLAASLGLRRARQDTVPAPSIRAV